jgi:hypothetical protein
MSIEITDEAEKRVLEEFKSKVEDLGQDDYTLTRFLRARDLDIGRAENMLRENLLWRKDNDMDHILEWKYPSYLPVDLPYAITGWGYEGGPVIWIPIGRWNHRPWVEQGYSEELLKWGFRLIEDGFQSLKQTDGGKCQAVCIIDMGNITYYQAAHVPSLKVLYSGFKALEQNYPEVLKCIVVVNAPWLFSIPFNFIKGCMSQHTLSKLKVYDSNKKQWINFLLEKCPQKSLPQEYFEDENGN